MKQAKQRTPPILARLISSTRQANRSIDSALAYVTESNRRLAKHKPGRLAQLLAEMPDGPPIDRAWECLTPVGQEVVDSAAAVQMQAFMASAPSEITQDTLKDLINEGRD